MNDEDRYTRITLRLPKELHARLDAAADKTSKSLNAEIVGRLEGSFVMNVDVLTSNLISELQKTQQELTKNRLRASVDQARDRLRRASVALTEARRLEAEPSTLRGFEAEFHSANADMVEAQDLLDATLTILEGSIQSPGEVPEEYLIQAKDGQHFRRTLKREPTAPEAPLPIRRRKS